MTIEISSAAVLRIMRSTRIASFRDGVYGPPHEKCGILRGRGERITAVDPAENVSDTPEVAFEIDPATLLAAYRAQRRPRALQVLGFFHTHPSGDPTPSIRDADCAAPDGKLWLIATSLQARLWRAVPDGAVHGRFDPVRFDLKVGKSIKTGLLEVRHVDYGRTYDVRIEEPIA